VTADTALRLLRRGPEIFSDDARVTRRDSEQCERGTLRCSSILLPVSKCVHADAEGFRKLRLRQPNESTQCGHITGPKVAANNPLTLAAS